MTTTLPSLKELIQKLIGCYQPVAAQQNSLFSETIHEELRIHESFDVIATLLGSLFYIVARCSKETEVRVFAAAGDGITEIVLQAGNPTSAYLVINQFEHLRMLSHKIGGVFNITGTAKGSDIVFSFKNKAAAVVDLNKSMLKAS